MGFVDSFCSEELVDKLCNIIDRGVKKEWGGCVQNEEDVAVSPHLEHIQLGMGDGVHDGLWGGAMDGRMEGGCNVDFTVDQFLFQLFFSWVLWL